jgi:hypothetical protein
MVYYVKKQREEIMDPTHIVALVGIFKKAAENLASGIGESISYVGQGLSNAITSIGDAIAVRIKCGGPMNPECRL